MVTGKQYADQAYSYKDSGLTYDEYDCIGFVNLVRTDLGLPAISNGTNTAYRRNLSWKGTIEECKQTFGKIPNGAMLFIVIPEDSPDYNPPPKYQGDGIGDVSHVGIYVEPGCMQSGGYGGRGVHYNSSLSGLHFTNVGMTSDIDYETEYPEPTTENPQLFNSFWVSPNLRMGAWSVETELPTEKQKINANNIKSFFINQGWTLEAICGMLGNMQAESTLNPAFIQETNRYRLPSNGTELIQLPNNVMKNFYMEYYGDTRKAYAIGLVQWDGYSNRNGAPQQKLVAYAISNNYNWYDGWCQCYRLQGEHDLDTQYHFFNPVTIGGVRYTFANYVTSTASPTNLAHAWQAGYERNAGGLGFRGINAEWWYEYFTGEEAPEPVDPEQPTPPSPDPDQPGKDFLPVWLWIIFRRKKEMKRPCRTI